MNLLKLFGCAVSAVLAGAAAASPAPGFDPATVQPDPDLHAKLPARLGTAGVLVVGSDTSYAPWEYLSEKDGTTPEGIDVDIAEAIARKLGLKLKFQTAQFDGILPALGSKYELGVSAFSITNERMQAVDFVSYFRSANVWAVKTGNPSGFDPANICGRRVAVQSSSSEEAMVKAESDACVAASKPAVDILPFETEEQCLTRVAAGGADAMTTGSSVIDYAVLQSKGSMQALKTRGALAETTLNGIAIAKKDGDLARVVKTAIDELIADNTYRAIFAKWGIDDAGIEKAEINPKVQ